MFLPIGRDDDGREPNEMTAKEISIKMTKMTFDKDFQEFTGTTEPLGKKEADLMRQLVHDIASEDSNYKNMTRDHLVGFRAGISYGIAMMVKLSQRQEGKGEPSKKQVTRLGKAFMTPYLAIDSAVGGFEDDTWFDNFMKNAKVAPEEDKKKSK